MKFTKIKRLMSYGDHNNIEIEGEIQDGETLENADKMLIAELFKRIGREKDVEYLLMDLSDLKQIVDTRLRKKEKLDSEIKELENKKHEIEKWLKKFNIPESAFDESETPF